LLAFYNILMLTCLKKPSQCMLLLLVEATVEPAPDTSVSCISGSLNAPRDAECSCGNMNLRWLSRVSSWRLEEGVVPSGCLWAAGWLYIRVVAVVGHRRAQGIVRRDSWLGLYDDHPFFVVLS
jgi:hypothetical protein